MSSGSSIESSYINSVVGEGTTFKGDIEVQGLVRIDGDFKGSIQSTGQVLIGKSGRAECNIKAETVVIGGAIKGNVIASKRIAILSAGLVLGNLKAPRLDIEDKVVFHGKCAVTQSEESTLHDSVIMSESYLDTGDIARYNPISKSSRS